MELATINKDFTEISIEPGKITTLTLSGRTELNILNVETINILSDKLDELAENEEVQALIITGKGNKAFCSGADIKELATMEESLIEDYVKKGTECFLKIQNFPAPVIAAINGFAFGAAFELTLACDIRFMAAEAKIGQPAVRHGLVPPFGGTTRLAQIVGVGKAKEIIFGAMELDAQESLRVGLANRIFPLAELMSEAHNYAERVCRNKPYAVAMAKKAINYETESRDNYNMADQFLVECLNNPETRKQLLSFFDKNKG